MLAIALGTLWLISQFRGFALLHTYGTLVRVETVPDDQMGAWEYTLTTYSFQTYPHQLRLVRGEYLSILAAQAEKDRFADQIGWETHSFAAAAIKSDRYPWFAFEHDGQWRILGFGPTRTIGSGQTTRTFDVPYWLLIVLFGTPALLAAKHRRRLAKRAREGRCLNCGYELDARMTVCPECGDTREPPSTT